MKRIILLVCAFSTFMVAQDTTDVTLDGQYKLTGVNVEYTYIARHDIELTVSDPYGFNITQTIQTISQGLPFNNQLMQLTETGLGAIGINLNLTLNDDGTGSISEGSFYPDINTITDDNGLCVTVQQVLPVTDDFIYL